MCVQPSQSDTTAFTKRRTDAPPGFFAAEANGLDWLRQAGGGPPLPEVLALTEISITLTRIDETAPTANAAEDFGRALAAMHRCGAPYFGADWPGFIGPLPLDNTPGTQWAEWYAERRVWPYLRQAVDAGAISTKAAQTIEVVCHRLPDTLEPPARIHGDLWSGNLLWGRDGRCWLIDPAAHGGHRETDLAMLALFGAPQLDRILASYDDAWPLTDGWRDRLGLHQLHPLLVHAVLFGGSYGQRAAAIAEAG
ncbi:MAG: fructosamine kinase family protein [Actinomycetes bacterium]